MASVELTLTFFFFFKSENITLICRIERDFNDPYLNSAVKKTNFPLSKIFIIIYHFWFSLRAQQLTFSYLQTYCLCMIRRHLLNRFGK